MNANAVLPDARPNAAAAAPLLRPRRKRRPVLFGVVILLLLVGAAAAALLGLLQHEPTFYRRAAVPPGPERRSLSLVFASRAKSLYDRIKKDTSWDETFSEEQINSFFEEGFLDEEFLRKQKITFTLPEHITDPRIAIESDRIRLGFRYHVGGGFSTVVSIAMRVWVAKAEANVVALEIQGMRAGALPLSAQSILERLSAAAESNDIKLSWYRYKGNPVAVLRFQSDQRATVQLENFDLHPGKIFIKGGSLEWGVSAPEEKR